MCVCVSGPPSSSVLRRVKRPLFFLSCFPHRVRVGLLDFIPSLPFLPGSSCSAPPPALTPLTTPLYSSRSSLQMRTTRSVPYLYSLRLLPSGPLPRPLAFYQDPYQSPTFIAFACLILLPHPPTSARIRPGPVSVPYIYSLRMLPSASPPPPSPRSCHSTGTPFQPLFLYTPVVAPASPFRLPAALRCSPSHCDATATYVFTWITIYMNDV